jgi:pimeloyl-ACP methyl ester carboxylesterase
LADDEKIVIKDPEDVFFHDVPKSEAEAWSSKVSTEPTQGWEIPLTYMGWREIPSHYILCEQDRMLPLPLQEHFSSLAGSVPLRMDAGHFPHVSQPQQLTAIIQQIASGSL